MSCREFDVSGLQSIIDFVKEGEVACEKDGGHRKTNTKSVVALVMNQIDANFLSFWK